MAYASQYLPNVSVSHVSWGLSLGTEKKRKERKEKKKRKKERKEKRKEKKRKEKKRKERKEKKETNSYRMGSFHTYGTIARNIAM